MRIAGITIASVVVFILAACREEAQVAPEGPGNPVSNLLINSSFEISGTPTLSGWTSSNESLVSFIPDAPFGGGDWSISVEATAGPPVLVTALVPARSGDNAYRMTVWGKRDGAPGEASIVRKSGDILEISKSASIEDFEWRSVTIFDTVFTEAGDSIGIQLSGGVSPNLPNTIEFDICLLEEL